jgi:hypothetical protein
MHYAAFNIAHHHSSLARETLKAVGPCRRTVEIPVQIQWALASWQKSSDCHSEAARASPRGAGAVQQWLVITVLRCRKSGPAVSLISP